MTENLDFYDQEKVDKGTHKIVNGKLVKIGEEESDDRNRRKK